MAITSAFTAAGLSAEDSFQGNVDLSIKNLSGVVLLECQYPGDTTWYQLAGFDGTTPMVDRVVVAGDSTVLYRFRCASITAGTTCNCYLGQA